MITDDVFQISSAVKKVILEKGAVLALESTLITHGLPYPQNLELAMELEAIVRDEGVAPATCGVIDGRAIVGLSDEEINRLAKAGELRVKVSLRDFGLVPGLGGTTVAATAALAARASIEVFSTGGIGGVHRDAPYDVSADLPALCRFPVIVVCSGAKSILDLPRTHEWLETNGVPIIGFGTDNFPAFYSRSSGLPVDRVVESALEIAEIWARRRAMDCEGGMLVCVPVPAADEWPANAAEPAIALALEAARRNQIAGKAITPFLLKKVAELSKGKSLTANLSLLRNNALVGAKIALAVSSR